MTNWLHCFNDLPCYDLPPSDHDLHNTVSFPNTSVFAQLLGKQLSTIGKVCIMSHLQEIYHEPITQNI